MRGVTTEGVFDSDAAHSFDSSGKKQLTATARRNQSNFLTNINKIIKLCLFLLLDSQGSFRQLNIHLQPTM